MLVDSNLREDYYANFIPLLKHLNIITIRRKIVVAMKTAAKPPSVPPITPAKRASALHGFTTRIKDKGQEREESKTKQVKCSP